MPVNLKTRLIRFSYWRINPVIVRKYFENELQGLSSYLKMGEPGKRDGEVKKSFLREKLGNSQVVIEVGANDGRDTVEIALVFPDALIYAVECDSRLFPIFLARTKTFANVIFYPFAASDNYGFTSFYESSGQSFGSSSLLPPNLINVNPDIIFNTNRKVLTGRISDLLKSIDCQFVDLLWMDVQGAEVMILNDLKSLLPRIGAIYLEVEMVELYKGEALYPDISKLLQGHGFFISAEFRSVDKLENVLFLNASFHEK